MKEISRDENSITVEIDAGSGRSRRVIHRTYLWKDVSEVFGVPVAELRGMNLRSFCYVSKNGIKRTLCTGLSLVNRYSSRFVDIFV